MNTIGTSQEQETPSLKPRYDVINRKNAYDVEVDLPGVKKNDLQIHINQNLLTIHGKRDTAVPSGWKSLHRELGKSDYLLRLRLNTPVDDNRMSANLQDGRLTLHLPLKKSAKPRIIKIT